MAAEWWSNREIRGAIVGRAVGNSGDAQAQIVDDGEECFRNDLIVSGLEEDDGGSVLRQRKGLVPIHAVGVRTAIGDREEMVSVQPLQARADGGAFGRG